MIVGKEIISSFSEGDVIYLIPNLVHSHELKILFHLKYGSRNLEYKSLTNVLEHSNLKQKIGRDVLKNDPTVEHWLENSVLDAFDIVFIMVMIMALYL